MMPPFVRPCSATAGNVPTQGKNLPKPWTPSASPKGPFRLLAEYKRERKRGGNEASSPFGVISIAATSPSWKSWTLSRAPLSAVDVNPPLTASPPKKRGLRRFPHAFWEAPFLRSRTRRRNLAPGRSRTDRTGLGCHAKGSCSGPEGGASYTGRSLDASEKVWAAHPGRSVRSPRQYGSVSHLTGGLCFRIAVQRVYQHCRADFGSVCRLPAIDLSSCGCPFPKDPHIRQRQLVRRP